jgi:hypothetical protein
MLCIMQNSSGSCIAISCILSSAFLYFLLYTTPGFFLLSVCRPDGVSFQGLLLLL